MIVESAQILSTVRHLQGDAPSGLYRPAYPRHPVVLWTAADPRHYAWLHRHFRALLAERAFRTGGAAHASARLLPLLRPARPVRRPPAGFCNCTPFPEVADVHRAYRRTLAEKWARDRRPPRWTRRGPPDWGAPQAPAGRA